MKLYLPYQRVFGPN